jgi:MFS family permease
MTNAAEGTSPKPAPTPTVTVATPPPDPTLQRTIACIGASVLLWTTQGLGMNFVAGNTAQIQGSLGATLTETNWLIAAYMAPNVSLTLILTKIRIQFGLRRFALLSLGVFVFASILHLFVHDLRAAVAIRFLAGIASSPVSTLGFLYMLDAFPASKKMSWGLSLALTCTAATPTLARLLSPALLDLGQWHELYMMEMGLALLAAAVVYLLPLTPIVHTKVLRTLDFVSYPLIALSFGLLAVVLTLGRYYWWLEAPWLGWCLAASILSLGLAVAIEAQREAPLLNVRWLMSREILHLAAIMLIFRLVLSEQTAGAIGLFQTVGLLNEQSAGLYGVILLASVAGGLTCGALLKPERIPALHGLALICVCIGAYLDSQATNLTRPANMYFSQALIAFGGALFLPPSLSTGLSVAVKRGPEYITSFIVTFLFTQSIGGLMGSAFFTSFVVLREQFHSSYLVERLTLSDPLVVERVRQLASSYGKVLTDSQLLNAEGLALLAQQATREANILAYNDIFLLICWISGFALCALTAHLLYLNLRQAIANRRSLAAA